MKTNLAISKYPEIPYPNYPDNFSENEIAKVKKLYSVDDTKAKNILKEKFYGALKPYGFDSWREYWKYKYLESTK